MQFAQKPIYFNKGGRMPALFDNARHSEQSHTDDADEAALFREPTDESPTDEPAEDAPGTDTPDQYDELRELFTSDPIAAVNTLLQSRADELLHAVEERITGVMQRYLTPDDDPRMRQMDMLVDRGFSPEEAAAFLTDAYGFKREAATDRSGDFMNRAVMETIEASPAAPDPEKQFQRAVRKAGNLDELFRGLRKIGFY
jgi:hypothetical protein